VIVQLEHNENDIKFAHKVYRLSAGIQKVKYLLRTVDKATLIILRCGIPFVLGQ